MAWRPRDSRPNACARVDDACRSRRVRGVIRACFSECAGSPGCLDTTEGAAMSVVSAIIVNWNGKHLLSECLDALRVQTRPADEVLVVDNGSIDGSQAMLRDRYPDVTLIALHKNRGFSVANNIGIRRAKGDYIALLN